MASILYSDGRTRIGVELVKRALTSLGIADDQGNVATKAHGFVPVANVALSLIEYLERPPLAAGDVVEGKDLSRLPFASVVRLERWTEDSASSENTGPYRVRTRTGWHPNVGTSDSYRVEFVPPEVT